MFILFIYFIFIFIIYLLLGNKELAVQLLKELFCTAAPPATTAPSTGCEGPGTDAISALNGSGASACEDQYDCCDDDEEEEDEEDGATLLAVEAMSMEERAQLLQDVFPEMKMADVLRCVT